MYKCCGEYKCCGDSIRNTFQCWISRKSPSISTAGSRQISTTLTYSKFYFNAGRNLPGYPKHVQNVMVKADQNPLQVLEFRPATM